MLWGGFLSSDDPVSSVPLRQGTSPEQNQAQECVTWLWGYSAPPSPLRAQMGCTDVWLATKRLQTKSVPGFNYQGIIEVFVFIG